MSRTRVGSCSPTTRSWCRRSSNATLPFALDVAKSAANPADPVSHLGLETKPFYLESDDTYKDGLPLANFTFEYSYGDPQEVRVIARRSLGDVTLMYSINGDPAIGVPTEEWTGGDRYGGKTDVHYRTLSGFVTGTDPGDSVEVWFEGGGETSESFTYEAVEESDRRRADHGRGGLHRRLAGAGHGAELPRLLPGRARRPTAPATTSTTSMRALGRPRTTWACSRTTTPSSGTPATTSSLARPGWGGGNASRLAMDEILEVRDFMNEGGKVLFTGKNAGTQYTLEHSATSSTIRRRRMSSALANPDVLERCRLLGGSPSSDLTNDMLQYWLGAYLTVDDAGSVHDDEGNVVGLLDVLGVDTPFTGLDWGFNGADSAANQNHSNSFITTSGILDPAVYPQFESWVAGRWDREGGPFEPHTGDAYAYSQIGDVSYKRLTRTIGVPAGGATMSFWTSYDTEAEWDHLAVEARTPGQEDWTTLPDANNHTTQSTGESCPAGWRELHPQLDHYQTLVDETCNPTGTTGSWSAASGNSGGWQQWSVDLSAYATAGQVEVSIGYISDWATQGLGVFVDDIEVSTGEGTTSFEAGDTGGWAITGPPSGSAPNPNNFIITTAAGFPEAAVVATPGSLMTGFGFEGITDACNASRLDGARIGAPARLMGERMPRRGSPAARRRRTTSGADA